MSHVVQFAIPTVDRLLGRTSKENQHGIEVESGTVSICIEGADGTGKSVMALHLAAAYACKAQRKHRVVYVGTDLSLSRAKVIWKNFALDYPSFRCKDPFTHAFLKDYQSADVPNGVGPIQLQPLNPIDALPPELVDEDADQAHFVWYVDLASSTAGDDWGFVNRLVASLLPPPANAQPHLVIVDSVDGLESFAGRRDVHGHRRTRRARSAQLLRTAAGKSHLALLVEGSRFTGRTPEEFAADAVIRVGFRTEGDYSARTIQVEKVRGQMHVRGQHDFTIRAGEGSTTGTMRNPDDPPVAQPKGTNCSQRQDQIMDVFGPLFDVAQPTGDTSRPPWQSYLHVFHSVHLRSREIMEGKVPDSADRQGHGLAPIRCAGFGVRYLDDLLWHSASTPALRDGDEYGLPVDAPTALIGEDGTYKSRLARAFLGQAFHPDNTRGTSDTLSTAAVLLTTRDINESEVRSYLSWHLAENDADGVATAIVGKPDGIYKDRVLCRRLEMHQLSGSALIHIVQSVVKKAQAAIFADAVPEDRKKRAAEGWRMRLVIDNWTTIEQTYPEIRNDPLVLPFLLFYLRREGITTLLVATDSSPGEPAPDSPTLVLRQLTPHHIYTWHVPFFGRSRVAITVSPPIPSDRRALVRELRSLSDVLRSQASPTTDVPQPHGSGNAAPSQDESNEADKNLEERKGRECLVVDPRFELYQGLETGKPSFVQLRVHLYAETEHYNEYIDEVNNLFSRWIFGHEGEHIVIAEPVDRYDGLRDFSHLQGGIRVDYTLVFQVDEFWAENNPMQLLNQYPYLWAETVDKHGKQAIVEDPFGVFQPTQYYNRKKLGGMTKGIERFRFFHVDGHDYERYPHRLRVDKVPYLWDFGFLLCDKEAWESASTRDVPTGRTLKVGDVWRSVQLDTKESRTWRDFLAACKVVAEVANAPYAFDVSMVATETFSCLVLEMWASEIAAKVGCEEAKKIFPPNRDANFADGLLKLLKDHRFRLFKAWLLLADVFQPNQCFAKDNVFQSRTVHKSAIAARHWYSTATAVVRSEKEGRIWIPCRLPGTHSVRGDWFLAIASGSRSPRLGQLAIDLLCTRRANIVRMQSGLGLPVRDWKESGAQELWTPFCKQGKTPGMPQARLNFNDLKKLGASDAVDGGFSWLWRTLLKGYDRHARTWQRWLASIIAEMRDALRAAGVQRYDQLKEPSDASGDREWHEFRKRCEWLVQSLERATLECDPGHETSDRT